MPKEPKVSAAHTHRPAINIENIAHISNQDVLSQYPPRYLLIGNIDTFGTATDYTY